MIQFEMKHRIWAHNCWIFGERCNGDDHANSQEQQEHTCYDKAQHGSKHEFKKLFHNVNY